LYPILAETVGVAAFWQEKTLEQMDAAEWESLCDGCARCCLLKLEDEDSGELYFTNVVCRYHHPHTCRCTRYDERNTLVPDCVKVTPELARTAQWLPPTCAYRLLAEGKPLPDWHPLVSGDPDSVREAGVSVRGKVISEEYVHPDELEEHLVNWFDR
jgi:uncharacterized cysteine cluster protein YcgN (CxxCxxCC family)